MINKSSYRSDITGLRAIAVLGVLIFHIFPNSLVGGYLGVDMFFVISGYLITFTLITEKQRTGSISLIAFYKRRIFRIAPATIFIILITLLLANLLMSFEDLITTSKSAIFSILGLANIYFYKYLDISYFARDIALNPLLHLWSLGVEEQFYFIFPLLFIFLSKYKRLFFILLAIVGIISIIWASIIVKTTPMFGYYMLPTRAFGFILGCLSALYNTYYYKSISPNFAKIISIISIILITLGFIILSKDYNLPNYLSLIVVIPTTVLIILGYKNQTFVHNILGSIYLKYIGLWSFSIYLIHWVILSFYKYINGIYINLHIGIIILFASIFLGGVSYYLIEQPLKFKRWNIAVALGIFIVIPFSIAQTNYYFSKKNSINYQKLTPKWPIDEYTCRQSHSQPLNIKDNLFRINCKHNAKLEPNIILWGDSNGYHYIPALEKIAKNMGFGFRNVTHGACPSLIVYNKEGYVTKNMPVGFQGNCNKASSAAYELVKNYDIVILSSSWVNIYRESNYKVLSQELDNTLLEISKTAKLILVIGNSPLMDNIDLNNIIQSSLINKNKNDTNGVNNTIVFKVNQVVKDVVSKHSKAYYLDFNNILCDEYSCQYKDGKNSLYYSDGIHLSLYGSNFIGTQYLNLGNIDMIFYKIKEFYKESSEDTFIKNRNLILK